MKLPDSSTEPIRRNLWIAAAVVAVASIAATLGIADDWTPQVVSLAIAAGLTEFAVIAFGVERARDKAWAPATHHERIDSLEQLVDQSLSAEDALGHVTIDDVPESDPGDHRL